MCWDFSTGGFDYELSGLRIRSHIALPELLRVDRSGQPDVIVRGGRFDATAAEPGLSVVDGGLLLTVPDVATYFISRGREIVIDPRAGVPEQNVRLYLLGSAMGALLHQRGLLPLHANAVEIHGHAIAFAGESGMGKSTLAAWFHDQGYRVLSDDVTVIHGIEAGHPAVYPSVRRLRLWRDALIASDRSPADYEPSFSGDPLFDKFDVPLMTDDERSACPLAIVIVLDYGDPTLEALEGVAAAEALFAHTYRGSIVGQLGTAELHWQAVTRLLPQIRTYRWSRPRALDSLDAQCATLMAQVAELGG